MISRIYSIRDEAAQSFGIPFFVTTEAQAIRSFKMLCGDSSSTVSAFPADFSLYAVGLYHDEDGHIAPFETGPKLVIRGDSFTKKE